MLKSYESGLQYQMLELRAIHIILNWKGSNRAAPTPHFWWNYMSHDMTKSTKWLCAQRRLRSARAVRSMGSQGPKLSSCGQRRLWSGWADAQADLSLRRAHTHFDGFAMRRLIFQQFCWTELISMIRNSSMRVRTCQCKYSVKTLEVPIFRL